MKFKLKNKKNIFIIEDDKVFAMTLKADIENAFKNIPIKIHLFSSGEISMEKFMQVMPQVVILDYHLNGKYSEAADGVKVLSWMKKENEATKVIMLTGDSDIEKAIEAFRHGAFDYVVKTEAKFDKINVSLTNVFKIIDEKRKKNNYKHFLLIVLFCLLFLIGGVFSLALFAPYLLK